MVQVSLLMANCRCRLKEAAARGAAHPLEDVPFDPERFMPKPVEHERCACSAGDPRSLHKPDPGVRLVCACRHCMHSHGRQCLQLAAEGEAYCEDCLLNVVCECACLLDESDGGETLEEALLFGEDVGVFFEFDM